MNTNTHINSDSESIRAYRNRIRIFTHDVNHEPDAKKRAVAALYLAEAATTLARLESESR